MPMNRPPIRLTYLITDLNVGGVPLHLYRLAQSLPADRFAVRVISLADGGEVGTMLRRAGVPVTSCGARNAADARALVRLWCLLREDRPDVLHAMLFHANLAARIVGPLAGLPIRRILCEIQTVEIDRRYHLIVDNLTCRLCRCEIGNSPSVIAHLRRRAHLPASRLYGAWGAVDAAAFDRADPIDRASLGLPADEPMIVWTGRLDPVKGFEEMLAAFARVTARRPARLVLAGEGHYRSKVEALIRDLGLSGRVLLLGSRSDVPRLLEAADLFLFCSRTEGLPNALLEALAAGLPIVATDVPGNRDLIDTGRTGILVPVGEPEAIARAVLSLLDHPAEAGALGQRGRDCVRRHHDLPAWRDRWAMFYDHIVEAGKGTLSSWEAERLP